MNNSSKQIPTKVLSEQGKRNIAEGAARRSLNLVAKNTAAVRHQMHLIEAELRENAGVYPKKAKLGVTELSRRAGLHPKSLFASVYAEFLAEVRRWLLTVSLNAAGLTAEQGNEVEIEKQRKGARQPREIAREWQSAYEKLVVQHMKTTDELMLERHKSKKRIEELEMQVENLQEKLRDVAKLHVLSQVKS